MAAVDWISQHFRNWGAMSIARALVEKHGKIAAVLFPASVLGGFAYSASTGTSPVEDTKKRLQGEAALASLEPERQQLRTALRKGLGEEA